jgi:hypothetical protein
MHGQSGLAKAVDAIRATPLQVLPHGSRLLVLECAEQVKFVEVV